MSADSNKLERIQRKFPAICYYYLHHSHYSRANAFYNLKSHILYEIRYNRDAQFSDVSYEAENKGLVWGPTPLTVFTFPFVFDLVSEAERSCRFFITFGIRVLLQKIVL
jgi:hypothetical protein